MSYVNAFSFATSNAILKLNLITKIAVKRNSVSCYYRRTTTMWELSELTFYLHGSETYYPTALAIL